MPDNERLTNSPDDFVARAALALGQPPGSDVELRLLGEGQFCVAVCVANELVLRFPKHEMGVESLRAERAIVPVLRGRVDVALPEPEMARLDLPIGQAFAAHRLVHGEVISASSLDALDTAQVAYIAEQVANLLDTFGGLGERAMQVGVPAMTLGEVGAEMVRRAEQLLEHHLTATQRRRTIVQAQQLAAIGSEAACLCHTDLGGNLVWDATQSRLGLLDLGACVVSDPLLDLASISVLGEAFTVQVAGQTSHLSHRVDSTHTIRATFALQDALNCAHQDAWNSVAAILETY